MSTYYHGNYPILCAYSTDGYEKRYLVYVRRDDDGVFMARVGKDNYVRYLTLDTLPDEMKMALALIHAYDWSKYPTTAPQQHHPDYPEVLNDVGWMTSAEEYTIVLSEKTLKELRGQQGTGTTTY